MNAWWLLPLSAVASVALTGVLRRYAIKRRLLDTPNARSSHSVPTPRAGGIAIVASYLTSLVALALAGSMPTPLLWAMLGGGALVAVVGFVDDLGQVAPRWRLLAHFGAAAWVLGSLDGMPAIELFGIALGGWIAIVLGAVYLVWLLNLYNFMDGIDGIAGAEAVCICAGAALLHTIAGQHEIAMVSLLLAAVAAGFLWWNLPQARIFMGDAGSGFLGIAIGALSLYGGALSPALFWSWLILLGVFVTDATVTLLKRLVRGEKVYEAHRSHAYQRAARRYGSHTRVTVGVVLIDLLWLLPVAASVGLAGLDGPLGLAIAYAPLVVLALWFGAGEPEGANAEAR